MAIERLDLATALGIAVYGAFFITMFARPLRPEWLLAI
jgi:hypothetical protein